MTLIPEIQVATEQMTEQQPLNLLPPEKSGIWLPFQRDDDDDIYTYEGWRKYRDRWHLRGRHGFRQTITWRWTVTPSRSTTKFGACTPCASQVSPPRT